MYLYKGHPDAIHVLGVLFIACYCHILQVEEYPCYNLTDKEMVDLESIQMPIFPGIDHTHSSLNTIVSLDGMCNHYYDPVTITMQYLLGRLHCGC